MSAPQPETNGAAIELSQGELLALLRDRLADESLVYTRAPERVTGGYENDGWAFELAGASNARRQLILRQFDTHGMQRRASFEATLHAALALQDFPVPRVLVAEDAGAFIVMERLPGVGLVDALTPQLLGSNPLDALRAAPQMFRLLYRTVPVAVARMERRLARVDARRVVEALESAGFPAELLGFERHLRALERQCDEGQSGLAPLAEWLRHNRPPEDRTILAHGDIVPNIVVDGERVSGVIDWSPQFVTLADPAFEVGNTLVLLSIKVPLPQPLATLAAVMQRAALRRYLREVQETLRLDPQAVAYYQTFRCAHALARVGRARQDGTEHGNPFRHPAVVQDLIEQVHRHTGTLVRLPPATETATDPGTSRAHVRTT